MKYSKLNDFKIRTYQENGKIKLLLLIDGTRKYYPILRDIFEGYFFSRMFPDDYGNYSWGTYIYSISLNNSEEFEKKLRNILNLFKKLCVLMMI